MFSCSYGVQTSTHDKSQNTTAYNYRRWRSTPEFGSTWQQHERTTGNKVKGGPSISDLRSYVDLEFVLKIAIGTQVLYRMESEVVDVFRRLLE